MVDRVDELIARRRYSVRADLLSSHWWANLKETSPKTYEALMKLIKRFGKTFVSFHLGEKFEPFAYDQALRATMPKRIFIFGSPARQRFFETPICSAATKWVCVGLPPQ